MKKVLLLALLTGFLMSCSTKILLPYEENPLCNAGKEGGYCGSLSDVYKYIEKQEENQ
ncbi:hypothetical protein [Persephonella sp.]